MATSILKQGELLIASLAAAPTDRDLLDLRTALAESVGSTRARAVVLDVSALDVIDSFATRTLSSIAQAARLRGARTVLVGIQAEVAFAMVQLGLTLPGIHTALDLEEGLAWLQRAAQESARGV